MSTAQVSMAEIRREGPWALRALGYPFGVADRATPQLQWVQAVHGDALTWLMAAESGIIASAALPAPTRSRDSEGGWRIAARGKCLIEVGPPAADLATCDARVNGFGHLCVAAVTGLHFAGAICALLVDRGLCVVCAYASGSEELAPQQFRRSGWIVAASHDEHSTFHAGSASHEDLDLAILTVRDLLAPDASSAERIGQDLAALRERAEDAPGMFAISVLAQTTDRPTPVCPHPRAARDWLARVARARAHGVTVTSEELRFLYALEERTWAPTSDRSRGQAAF